MKLLSIKPSPNSEKKLVATFEKDGRTKTTHFGAKGYQDYTQHKDPERRRLYIERHKSSENWSDPTSAGALSRYVLWGESTSLARNIAAFKKRFSL